MVNVSSPHYSIDVGSRAALLKLHAQTGVPSHPLSWKLAVQLRDYVRMDERHPDFRTLEVDLRETSIALRDIMLGPPLTPTLRRNPRRDHRSVADKNHVEEAIDRFCDLVKRHYRR